MSGSFDDRRPSSLRTTNVVPTKIAWCAPSFITSLSSLSLLKSSIYLIRHNDRPTNPCPVCNIVGSSSSHISSLSSDIPCITPCASKPGFLLVCIVKPLKFLPTNDSRSVAYTQIRYHIICFTASFVTVCSKLFPPVV